MKTGLAAQEVYQLKFNLAVISKLSRQPDSLSLIDSMLSALAGAASITSVAIFEVYHAKGACILNVADANQLVVKTLIERPWLAKDQNSIPALVFDCILQQKSLTNSRGEALFCFPVLPENSQVGHVLLLAFKHEQGLQRLIKGHQTMFEVFANLLKLFDQIERDELN